jgi:hypothetical protein
MAENDGQVTEPVTDAEREAEWARLEGEEGQPAKAPDTSEPSDEPGDAGGDGQGGKPPHIDPAAEKPAGSGSSTTDADLWKDAPEPLRNAFEAERAAREKADQTIRSNNGRLSAESRRAAELEAEVLTLRGKTKAEKPAEEAPALPDEARKQLEEEFPDVAAPLLKVIGSLEAKVAELAAGNASADERRLADVQLEQQRLYAEEEQKLAGEHSDWRTVAATPAFAEWANAQPRAIQEALRRNGTDIVDAAEASLVIGMFKTSAGVGIGKTDERRERQLRGNLMPDAKVPGSTTSATSDREAEWKRLEAVDAAKEARKK